MDKNTALKNMSESLEIYRQEINLLFEQGSKETATKGDLEELSRQVFYVLDSFQRNLEKF